MNNFSIKHKGITYIIYPLNEGGYKVNGVVFQTLEHLANTIENIDKD